MLPKMQVSVTEKCQMKCIYCDGWKKAMRNFNQGRKVLSVYDILEIIRCGIEAGLREVHFTGGEPFLRDDLIRLVKATTEMGVKVEVNTNGLLITEENVKLLKQAGCSLFKISLDTTSKQKYKAIRGVDAVKKIIDGIKIANQIIPVRVNCVVMRSNLDTIIPLIDFMNEIGVPRIHLLDLTYYPFKGGRNFWQKEFVYLAKEILPIIEKKTREKFTEIPIFGCSFYALSSGLGKITIVLKEANPTMRSLLHCSCCQDYCHEGMFTLRLSAGGYLNICPVVNGLGIDAVAALKKGRLLEEYERFSRIFDETEQVDSFPIFLKRNRLTFKNKGGEKSEDMLC